MSENKLDDAQVENDSNGSYPWFWIFAMILVLAFGGPIIKSLVEAFQ